MVASTQNGPEMRVILFFDSGRQPALLPMAVHCCNGFQGDMRTMPPTSSPFFSACERRRAPRGPRFLVSQLVVREVR
jgi:hypothetical protein